MKIEDSMYEKLGAFYLGREYDVEAKELQDELVLYDSKDLVTHGVVLGMTGSGKTGLCLSLLEEAAMDGIPAIVIDPKGDIANLLLAFPDLAPSDFRPWINEDDARKKGISPDEFAQGQAELWEKGLAEWGQGKERIKAYREKTDLCVYTPGSKAGIPISILSSLKAPPFEILDDGELLAERIESTVSSLLSLMGVDADPMQDPEAVYVSNIFKHFWTQEQDLTLPLLIQQIQAPPFDKIGVLDLESYFPEKKRFALAMQMNNLLASPSFGQWMEGEALDIQRMMYTEDGKPRISIFSIAHLDDSERMFFVSLLLNAMLGWMRAQSGTSSLRAMLYMDEIYGYLPPTANPPSKKPMMTMLKQARAFGLGVLLATQNPVDLDYKALSNIGTWFLGRLQTERDKMRVLDGLEGAAGDSGQSFDRGELERLLSGLGSRVFLMNNVHESGPVTFHVRWVMSYLRGPLSRKQIKELMDPIREEREGVAGRQKEGMKAGKASLKDGPAAESSGFLPPASSEPEEEVHAEDTIRPNLPQGVADVFLPLEERRDRVHYEPAVIRSAEVRFDEAKKKIHSSVMKTLVNRIDAERSQVLWDQCEPVPEDLNPSALQAMPPALEKGAVTYGKLPAVALKKVTYSAIEKDYVNHLYAQGHEEVYFSPLTEMYSELGEEEGAFRARLVHAAREKRDELVEELREKYEKKIERVQDSLKRAEDTVAEQKSQATSAKLSAAASIGAGLLGAFFGRRSVITSGRRGISGASRAMKESRDVKRAEEKVERYQEDIEELEDELKEELAELESEMDPMKENLETVRLSPLKKNITPKAVGVIWLPK